MTTVLNREEIFLPTTRRPNKVNPMPVPGPEEAYVIGRPRFSVQDWTPEDHYAGPALLPEMIIREARERGGRGNFARRTIKSSEVPILRPDAAALACRGGAAGPIYRDFYAGPPSDFWPCTRDSMEAVGMNAELKVIPTFAGLEETRLTDTGKALAVAGVAGVLGYFLTRRMLRSR